MSYTNFHKLSIHIHLNHIIFSLIQTTSYLPSNQCKSTPPNLQSNPNTTLKNGFTLLFFINIPILKKEIKFKIKR